LNSLLNVLREMDKEKKKRKVNFMVIYIKKFLLRNILKDLKILKITRKNKSFEDHRLSREKKLFHIWEWEFLFLFESNISQSAIANSFFLSNNSMIMN